MSKKCFFLLIFALILIKSGNVFADDKDPHKLAQLPEVVVVATPIIEDNRINKLGSQVTIISKEQIADLNAQDLPSALRRTPGVVISRYNPIGSFGGADGGAIYIRGMGSSRPGGEIQTLVDGVPRFVGVWSHPLMDNISIDHAEKIEVYKGAQPVLFGNTVFGAINLTTKRQLKEGFFTKFQGSFGSFTSFTETFEHGGKIKATDYYLVQSFRASQGHRDNAGGQIQQYFARIGHQLTEVLNISLTLSRTDSFVDDPGPEGRPDERQGRYKIKDNMGVVTLSCNRGSSKGFIKAYWNTGNLDWTRQYDIRNKFYFDTITDYANYGIRSSASLLPWNGGDLTAGFDLDYFGGKVLIDRPPPRTDSIFPDETFNIISPYIALSQEIGVGNGWLISPSAGVRFFHHNKFDERWGPQAGIILSFQETSFHASYAKGISYPGVFVIAQSNMLWNGNRKWETLKPETVDHYEVGVSHRFNKWIKADITYFLDDGRDRFVLVTTPPPTHYENIESFRMNGIETTLTVTPTDSLALFAGGTFFLSKSPDKIPYTPDWTITAGANYRFMKNFRLNIDATYLDKQYVSNTRSQDYGGANIATIDSFFLLNGKISYDFLWKANNIRGEIFISGENLTDTRYMYKKDYPMPGINGMAGVTLKF